MTKNSISYDEALTAVRSSFVKATALGDDSIIVSAIKVAETAWREASKKEFDHLHVEEIAAGEFAGRKYTAHLMLHSFRRRQDDVAIKATSELRDLHEMFTKGLFAAAGYETMIEYLNAGGIAVTGPTSDYLGIVQEIIPWCEAHKMVVADMPVNLDWFSRFIGTGAVRKCIASRTRKAMKLMRSLIADETIGIIDKVMYMEMILNSINNPSLSLADLDLRFREQYTEDVIYADFTPNPDGSGVLSLNVGNRRQLNKIKKRLKGVVEIA